jgi:hypothetical protein
MTRLEEKLAEIEESLSIFNKFLHPRAPKGRGGTGGEWIERLGLKTHLMKSYTLGSERAGAPGGYKGRPRGGPPGTGFPNVGGENDTPGDPVLRRKLLAQSPAEKAARVRGTAGPPEIQHPPGAVPPPLSTKPAPRGPARRDFPTGPISKGQREFQPEFPNSGRIDQGPEGGEALEGRGRANPAAGKYVPPRTWSVQEQLDLRKSVEAKRPNNRKDVIRHAMAGGMDEVQAAKFASTVKLTPFTKARVQPRRLQHALEDLKQAIRSE